MTYHDHDHGLDDAVDVYVVTSNMSGYMPNDDTPHVFVGTAHDAVEAHAEELARTIDDHLDHAAACETTPYAVDVDGLGAYYVDDDDTLRVRQSDDEVGDEVGDILADVRRRLDDYGAVRVIAECGGAYGTYVDATDAPSYYHEVARVDDDAYAEVAADVYAARTRGDSTYHDYAEVVDDVRDAAYDALDAVHVRACRDHGDTTCDINAAAGHGHTDAALHAYAGATETPRIIGTYLGGIPADVLAHDLDAWYAVARKVSAECGACGAYTYLDAYYHDVHDVDDDAASAWSDTSTRCGNCLAHAVKVPAYVYRVRTDWHGTYSQTTTHVRTRADVGADSVAESHAERIAQRVDGAARVDGDDATYAEIDQMPDYEVVRRGWDTTSDAYYVDVRRHDDDDDADTLYAVVYVDRVDAADVVGIDLGRGAIARDAYDVPAYDYGVDVTRTTYDAPRPWSRTSSHVTIATTLPTTHGVIGAMREFQEHADVWTAYAYTPIRRDDHGAVVYDVVYSVVDD